MSFGAVLAAWCPRCDACCFGFENVEAFELEHENCAELLELFGHGDLGPFVDYVDLFEAD